jgi:hypothetical protein
MNPIRPLPPSRPHLLTLFRSRFLTPSLPHSLTRIPHSILTSSLPHLLTLSTLLLLSNCKPPTAVANPTPIQPAQTTTPTTPNPAPQSAKRPETPAKPDFIFGALDKRPDLTFEQRKTIRVANAILLREKAKWAMEQGQALQLPAGRLEIELLKDPVIAIGKGQKLQLSGVSDEETVIMCYPLVRPHREEVFLDHLPGAHLNLEQITVARPDSNRWETYTAQWTAASDSLYTITLTSANLRPGWHNHLIGQTLYYTYNDKKVGGKLTIVQVNPETHSLTAKGMMPAEEPVAGQQRVAWDFPADILPHLYRQYGALWYETGTSSTAIKHLEGHPLKQPGVLDISHFTTRNFSIGLMRSGGQFDLNIQQSRIHGQEIALNFFVGNEVNTSVFYIDSMVIHHSGFKSMGDISPNISANKIWGSGGYLHPNVTVKANRLYCLENAAGAWRQFSGTGVKPIPIGSKCTYENCSFLDNTEYNLFLSGSMPSEVINCTFRNSNNKIGLSSKFINCKFILEEVHGYPISEPKSLGADTILFKNCFFENSNVVVDWKSYGASVTLLFSETIFLYKNLSRKFSTFFRSSTIVNSLIFDSCHFEVERSNYTTPYITVLDNLNKIYITNCSLNLDDVSIVRCKSDCSHVIKYLKNNTFNYE